MNDLPDFIITPRQILEDKKLRPLDSQVYGIVYWYAQMKLEKCTASNRTIAELLKVYPTSVSKSINRLLQNGHIKVIINEENGNYREIVPLVTYCPNGQPPIAQMDKRYSSNGQPNKRIYNNNNKYIKKEIYKERKLSLYNKPELITDLDFQEIANKYQVPQSFVKSKYDDMLLWAGERPGNPKTKGRNWRLTLMKWVKTDAIKIKERGNPYVRPAIDARQLT